MSVQKKIRDLERLLRKKAGDPDAVATLEAKIADLKEEKTGNAIKERERKYAVKYHMVKFFERKKLTRKIRSLDNKIKESESTKEKKKLIKEREKVKEDLAYVLYYPKGLKYVALFADSGAPDDSDSDGGDGGDGASKSLSARARELALAAWRLSTEREGDKDRVEDAIEVEYAKPLKGASIRLGAKAEKGGTRGGGGSDSDSGSGSGGSDSSADSGSDSDSAEDEPAPRVSASAENGGPKRPRDEQKLPASKKVKAEPDSGRKAASKPSAADDFVPDAFFAEEADDAGDVEEAPAPAPSWTDRGSGRGRGGALRGGRSARGGRNAIARGAASGELTKQESRLLSWQSGTRGRGKSRGGRGGAARGDDSGEGRESKSPSAAAFPAEARGRPASAGRGAGRGAAKPAGGGAGRAQHNGVAPRKAVVIGEKLPNNKIVFED